MGSNCHPPLLLIIIFFLVASPNGGTVTISSGFDGGEGGDWVEVASTDDPYVVGLAKFAVQQHNIDAGARLGYVKLMIGETQLGNGINYRLTIMVNEENTMKDYEAIVNVVPRFHTRKLVSFKSV